jgi:hypothetical protein
MGGKPGDNGDSGTVKLRLNEERKRRLGEKENGRDQAAVTSEMREGGPAWCAMQRRKRGGWQHRAWGRGARLAPRLGHGRHGRHTVRVGEGAKGLTCGPAQDLNQN